MDSFPNAVGEFEAHFLAHAAAALRHILWAPGELSRFGLRVDLPLLFSASPALANALLSDPLAVLPLADEAARRAQAALLARGGQGPAPKPGAEARPKPHVRARLARAHVVLPLVAGVSVRDACANRVVVVCASVARASPLSLRACAAEFVCLSCGAACSVPLDAETGAPPPPPEACPAAGCGSARFTRSPPTPQPTPALCCDTREALLVPASGPLAFASPPPSHAPSAALVAVLDADLAHSLHPGEEAVISGVLRRRWRGGAQPGGRAILELVLHVLSVDKHAALFPPHHRIVVVGGGGGARFGAVRASLLAPNCSQLSASPSARAPRPLRPLRAADPLAPWRPIWAAAGDSPLASRDALVASLCPSLSGLFRTKLALLLALVGGACTRVRRGEIHVLLAGEPGTGKSALLRAAASLIPHAVLATGGACTAAGLTAAAVKEGGSKGWSLEAGALVRAHGSVAAVDEIDALPAAQRDALHEALEQRTVSVAKAGLTAVFPCAATLLAACNLRPASRGCVESATGLAAPLLSRFDLVIPLRDYPEGGRGGVADARRAAAILSSRTAGARAVAAAASAAAAPAHSGGHSAPGPAGRAASTTTKPWSGSDLSSYVSACRACAPPSFTAEAEALVGGFYSLCRRGDDRGGGRATPRLLDGALRLTAAHARLCGRAVAGRADAVEALALMRHAGAAAGSGGGGSGGDSGGDGSGCGDAMACDATGTSDADNEEEAARLEAQLDAVLGPSWRGGHIDAAAAPQQQQREQAGQDAQRRGGEGGGAGPRRLMIEEGGAGEADEAPAGAGEIGDEVGDEAEEAEEDEEESVDDSPPQPPRGARQPRDGDGAGTGGDVEMQPPHDEAPHGEAAGAPPHGDEAAGGDDAHPHAPFLDGEPSARASSGDTNWGAGWDAENKGEVQSKP